MWSSGANIACWGNPTLGKDGGALVPSPCSVIGWAGEVASVGMLYQNLKMLQVEAVPLMVLIAAELQVLSWREIEVVHFHGCPADLAWKGVGVPATSSRRTWSRGWEGRLKHGGLIESCWRSNYNTTSPQVCIIRQSPTAKWSFTGTQLCPSVYMLPMAAFLLQCKSWANQNVTWHYTEKSADFWSLKVIYIYILLQ